MRSFIKTSSAQKHLERKLEELAESLKEAEAAVAFSRAREAVLCCLISNQEVLQSLLQRLYAWMAGRSVEEAPLGPHLPLFVQQRLSSITRLMSCASSRQIHQAFGMGQCQWSAHKHDHFLRCVSLLELVMRPGVQIDHGKDWGAAAASIVAHAVHARQDCNSNGNNDVAMLSPPLGGPGQAEHGSGNRSGGDGDGGSESPKAAVAGADGNSGAGHSSDGGLARCFMPVMKEALTLNALALLVKPRAILEATLNPDLLYPDPPQGHWMRVLQRMRLTDHQLLLLSLAADEYQRMSAALAQDEVRLAVLVARQSLLLAGEERRTAAAAAAVSAPTDTVTAAAGPGADGDGKHSPSGRALSVLPGQVTSKAVLHDNDVQRALGEDPRGAEQVDAVLRRHQWQRCVHVVMMSVFFHDTVTPVQLALMASSSYPYWPHSVSLACEARELLRLRGVTREQAASTLGQATAAVPAQPQPSCPGCCCSDAEHVSAAELHEHTTAQWQHLKLLQHWWGRHISDHGALAGTAAITLTDEQQLLS